MYLTPNDQVYTLNLSGLQEYLEEQEFDNGPDNIKDDLEAASDESSVIIEWIIEKLDIPQEVIF